jgi:predicted Zn-dependent protease
MKRPILKTILTAFIIKFSIFIGTGWALESTLSDKAETYLWHLAENEQNELEQNAILFHQETLNTYILQISEQLWRHADTDLPPIQVRIIEDPELNAFAYPNGVIYLTTGVIAHTRNEDQLSAVIAHEMVHYIRRHSLAAFGFSQDPGSLSRELSGQPYVSGLDIAAADITSLCNAAERQADQEGLAMVSAAGYNPHEMLLMLTRFQKVQQQMNPEDSSRKGQKISWRIRLGWIENLLENIPDTQSIPASGALSQDHLKHISQLLLANAKACIRMGYWDQASGHVESYSRIYENDPHALYLKGKIEQYRQPDNILVAAAYYQKAVDIKHDFASAHLALGMMHYKAGKLQVARKYFEKGLELAPDNQQNAYIRQYIKRCRERQPKS